MSHPFNGHAAYQMTAAEIERDRRSAALSRATAHCRRCPLAAHCEIRGTAVAIRCRIPDGEAAYGDLQDERQMYQELAH